MIELAIVLGWRLDDVEALDDVQLATLVDVLQERETRRG
jgi:hypothetical protein